MMINGDAKHHVISIPVKEIENYDGYVAEDIITSSGALLLPKGMRTSLLGPSMGKIVALLIASGVQRVALSLEAQIDENSLEAILERILLSHGAMIDLKCSKDTVQQVEKLFGFLRNYPLTQEMVIPMLSSGKKLLKEIKRCPTVVFSLARVKERDRYIYVHSFNVAVMSGFLAMKLYPEDPSLAEKAILGGLLHDIGMCRIPPRILYKNGFLDDAELAVMRQHPLWGEEMVLRADITSPEILSIIRYHHERWSGGGYPYGLNRRTIPILPRITAVADAFDTLTTHKIYGNTPKFREALSLILGDAGGQFDPTVSRALLTSLGLYPPGSIVELSGGAVGIVVTAAQKDLVRPVVLIKEGTGEDVRFVDLRKSSWHIKEYLGAAERREI